jgi:hypothetical protein
MNTKHEVSNPEDWQNEYDPEMEKMFKKIKPDAYYQTIVNKFFPRIQALFNKDVGDEFEAIDQDDEDSTVMVTSITPEGKEIEEPTKHPFVSFAKCEGQKRGGFELAFIAREKKTGDVTQALAYFSPPNIGKIDVSWATTQPSEEYTWKP